MVVLHRKINFFRTDKIKNIVYTSRYLSFSSLIREKEYKTNDINTTKSTGTGILAPYSEILDT